MPIYRRASRHPVNAPRDRVDISCPTCHGEGRVNRHVMPPEELRPVRYDTPDALSAPIEYRVERGPCDTCAGRGYVTPKDGDRVDVFQDGAKIGSCTVPATVRPHLLVDRRHGDYRPRLHEGRMIYEASNRLCPGDIEQLVGFVWERGNA